MPGGARLAFEIVTRGQLEPALQEMAARMLPIWWVGCVCVRAGEGVLSELPAARLLAAWSCAAACPQWVVAQAAWLTP